MKNYIKAMMEEAHINGSPVIRTMFYEFPEDEQCWNLTEQYMFGSKYLVAHVLYEGHRKKEVYLPKGIWRSLEDGVICEGKQTITVETPLDVIPVFEKM